MEETFMKFAKSSGGLLGLFNNFGAYQKWCCTTSARAQLYELTLEMCDMIDDPDMPKAGMCLHLKDCLHLVLCFGNIKLLVKSQMMEMPIDLDELMRYPLSPVPHALGSPDGYFAKTNKATILYYLLEDRNDEISYPKDALFIQDGNALFHMMTKLPPTCGEICMELLDQMIAKHHFVFSTDCYQPDSIKGQERLRRGFTEKYLIDGPHTCKPYDFKAFLSNELNKKQLCNLLLKVWGSNEAASRTEKCKKAVMCEGRSYDLTSTNGKVLSLCIGSPQDAKDEGTDTRLLSVYLRSLFICDDVRCLLWPKQ
ncbi:hypothetical protein ABVT39_018114 [Epinephelus coioides]